MNPTDKFERECESLAKEREDAQRERRDVQRYRAWTIERAKAEEDWRNQAENRRLAYDHPVERQRRDFVRFAAVHHSAAGMPAGESVARAERLWDELSERGHARRFGG